MILPDGKVKNYDINSSEMVIGWTLSKGYGKKYVYVECYGDGNEIGQAFDSIEYVKEEEVSQGGEESDEHQSGPPYGLSVEIENGKECTNDRWVTVSFTAHRASECTYRARSKFVLNGIWQEWEPYVRTKRIELPLICTHCRDVYVVEYKCRNSEGVSNTVSDEIIYDDVPPDPPEDVRAEFTGSNVYIEWEEVSDAVKYEVYRMKQTIRLSNKEFRPEPDEHGEVPVLVGITSRNRITDRPPEDGAYKYYVVPVDCAGNRGEHSFPVGVYVDTHSPEVEITSPENGIIVHSSPLTVSFNAEDDHADRLSCHIFNNNVRVWDGTVISGRQLSVIIPLRLGTNFIEVKCSDGYNMGSDYVQVILMTLEPEPGSQEVEYDSEPFSK